MKHPFTEEQIAELAANPYTLFVDRNMIRFTVEFKSYLLKEVEKPGVTLKKAFINAGYDPEVLGLGRMGRIIQNIRKEAKSPKGLHETGKSKSQLVKEDLTKKQMKTAIKELQEEVVRLQQQVEFLKKIHQLPSKEDKTPEIGTKP
jgi:hypothetical protein